MPTPRSSPWVTITQLKRLLVGESQCEWASWFMAHYQRAPDEYMPSDFDTAQYNMNHTALMRVVRARLEGDGYEVFSEGQNDFRLLGRTGAYLVGRPDFVAVRDTTGLIVDAKTGQPRDSDSAQVLLYMWAVPRALNQYSEIRFSGQLAYQTHTVDIPDSSINDSFSSNFGSLIQRVISPEPAMRIPSGSECRFCNITKANCEQRIDWQTPEASTTEF
ncbi:PD-(D/E)XK nuclease family protein [SAR202 cluster bacterium AC-647-N09_OGT_505m]|nr:PD-(D/E)XK nuclease family protein [SAR202 cluster bacterium AC-647-N09_OGT_505m]